MSRQACLLVIPNLILSLTTCVGQTVDQGGSYTYALAHPLFFPGKVGYISMPRATRAYFLTDRVVYKIRDLALEVEFLGATKNVGPQGEDQQATMVNYLVGD